MSDSFSLEKRKQELIKKLGQLSIAEQNAIVDAFIEQFPFEHRVQRSLPVLQDDPDRDC